MEFTLVFNGTTHNEHYATKGEVFDRINELRDTLNDAYDRPVQVIQGATLIANIGNIGIASQKTEWIEVPLPTERISLSGILVEVGDPHENENRGRRMQ